MLGRRVALVFGWFLGLLLFAYAKPVFAIPGCETVTERLLSELVVPLGDEDHPQLPRVAVKLLPGESICLTGKLDGSGDLENLEVVADATGRTGPLLEVRLQRGTSTTLLVRHWGKAWLYYDAMQVVTEQDIALPTRTLPVGPGQLGGESWDPGVRKLLLYGFRFGPNPAPSEPRRLYGADRLARNASMTFGLWGGERSMKLDELSRGLGRDGYYSLPRNAVMGGLDLDWTIYRVRIGLGFGGGSSTTRQRSSGKELVAGLSDLFFAVGYDVLRFEQLHVFLGTGIGRGQMLVDRPEGSTLFPDVQPWEGDVVRFSAPLLPFEIGTDYLVPLARAGSTGQWVLQFGARVGWLQQLGGGGWETDADRKSRDLPGPSVDLSGPRGRLVIGVGVENRLR